MGVQYICKSTFSVDKYDEDGNEPIGDATIHKGDIFELSESPYRIIDGEVRLVAVDGTEECDWLEISRETLNTCFDKIGVDTEEN